MKASQLLRAAALNRLKAVGAELAAPLLLLFQNEIEITPDTVFADLVEADFTGYARPAALAFSNAFLNVNEEWELTAPSEVFVASGVLVTNVIYGWAIVTAAGDNLLIAELLPEPVAIDVVGDGVVIQPRLIYGA